jgi:hypothetical protein
MNFLPSYQYRQNTLVVVNLLRVGVDLDKKAHRGAIVSVDLIEKVIDCQMNAELQTWLASPASPCYVMHIPAAVQNCEAPFHFFSGLLSFHTWQTGLVGSPGCVSLKSMIDIVSDVVSIKTAVRDPAAV